MAALPASPSTHRTVLVGLVVAFLFPALAGCAGEDPESAPRANAPGAPAPEWSGATLDGRTVALSDFEGDVVILNIWATWCAPCVHEMPLLDALHRELSDRGLHVIGASVDRGRAGDRIQAFVDENDIDFQILLDPDQQVMTRFRAIAVPETFLIGHDGVILHRWIGPFDPTTPHERVRIEDALEARANSSSDAAAPSGRGGAAMQ